uniref:Uncharacterized protein n=1 Tax=Strongyloides papillosus TaxID=174720 RepID=A0A0N5B328_STREA
MVKLSISVILFFNLVNYSYSTKDLIADKINKLDEAPLEVKDPATKEIAKMISSTMKFIDLPLELGNNENYVKNKPFVKERLRQNLKMIGLLSAQINDNLLPFITQDFGDLKSKKENMDNKLLDKVPGPSGRFPLFPFPFPWTRPRPQPQPTEKDGKPPIVFEPYFP